MTNRLLKPSVFILLLFILIPTCEEPEQVIESDYWVRTFGSIGPDWGNSVQQTSDGGYIIAGYTTNYQRSSLESPPDGDIWLIKVDALGHQMWTKTFGDTLGEEGYSIQHTADGGYVIVGRISGYIWLLKTDASGDTVWTKNFKGLGRKKAHSVQQTFDGGYIIIAERERWNHYPYVDADTWLIKTDASGDTVWTKTFDNVLDDVAYCGQQTLDGGYILVGSIDSRGIGRDVWLVKTDASGNTIWTRRFGGELADRGFSVRQTSDGGYILAGYTGRYPILTNADVFLVKTDASGDTVWTQSFGDRYYDEGYSVQQTADGGYIIVGDTDSDGTGNHDIYLIKTDASGNLYWERTFGGHLYDWGYSVQQTTDEGYIITGKTKSLGAGSYDVLLIKTDDRGNTAPFD